MVVKGKTEPVGVYEVLDYHTDETFPNLMDVVNYFRDGVASYRRGEWDKAIGAFRPACGPTPATRRRRPTSTGASSCAPTRPRRGTASGR